MSENDPDEAQSSDTEVLSKNITDHDICMQVGTVCKQSVRGPRGLQEEEIPVDTNKGCRPAKRKYQDKSHPPLDSPVCATEDNPDFSDGEEEKCRDPIKSATHTDPELLQESTAPGRRDLRRIHNAAEDLASEYISDTEILEIPIRSKSSEHINTHTEYKDAVKRHMCTECGKTFSYPSDLVMHKRSHTGEKPYTCRECGRCFNNNSNLTAHRRIHSGEKPYSCEECGRCFNNKSNLAAHRRIHSGEKPYACGECGKTFTRSYHLILHSRTHTGERTYECEWCGKGFISSSMLHRHERIHTGEKPYACSQCGKCFADSSSLVQHDRMHRGEKPFGCTECEKRFTRRLSLIKHQRIHGEGEKLYICNECGKSFSDYSLLVSHQKSEKLLSHSP